MDKLTIMDALSKIRTTFLLKQLERKFQSNKIIQELNKLEISDNKSILIIAPHPDDEVIGCGGLIQYINRSENSNIHVLFVTVEDERSVVKPTFANGENIRFLESKEAKTILKYKKAYYLSIKERTFKIDANARYLLQKKITDLVIETNADYIFIPNHFDMNPDHRSISEISLKQINALLGQNLLLDGIYLYEIWGPVKATHFINLTPQNYKTKTLAMECYRTQMDSVDYKEIIAKLSELRKKQYFQYCSAKENKVSSSSMEFFEYIDPSNLNTYLKKNMADG